MVAKGVQALDSSRSDPSKTSGCTGNTADGVARQHEAVQVNARPTGPVRTTVAVRTNQKHQTIQMVLVAGVAE